ncbi:hypothetical protein ACFXJM_15735 [Streptomyces massasporeus]
MRMLSVGDVAATIARSVGGGGLVVVPEGFPPVWRSALRPERVLTTSPACP